MLTSAVGSVWTGLKTFGEWLREKWDAGWNWFKETAIPLLRSAVGSVWTGLKTFGEWLTDQWPDIKTWFTKTLPEKLKTLPSTIWDSLPDFTKFLSDLWNDFKEWLESLPRKIAAAITGINIFQALLDQFNAIQWNFPSLPSWLGGGNNDTPQTPPKDSDGDGIPDNIDSTPFPAPKPTPVPTGNPTPTPTPTPSKPPTPTPTPTPTKKPTPSKPPIPTPTPTPTKKPITGGGGGGSNVAAMSSGGMVMPKYFAIGGPARGTDTVSAMLTPGEFVMSRYAVDNYGVDKMKAINNGTYQDEKVYNYNLSINVKSDANPDDIARAVMTQIKQIDSQRIRTQRP